MRKPEAITRLERPSSRWEKYIKMAIKEIESAGLDWIRLAQDWY